MFRLCVRAASAALVVLALLGPATAQAAPAAVGKIQGETFTGSGVVVGYRAGHAYVLTAAHCTKGDISFNGYKATVLARDTAADIALLAVKRPAPASYSRVAPEGTDSGTGWRYGYPHGRYLMDRCGIDDDGILSEQATPGASGGPIISANQVVGIVTHVGLGVPAHKIRSFLKSHDHEWLFAQKPLRKAAPKKQQEDDSDVPRPRMGGRTITIVRVLVDEDGYIIGRQIIVVTTPDPYDD